jgi:hypothetical protein
VKKFSNRSTIKRRGDARGSACPFRKLYPEIIVVKSTEDWDRGKLADPFDLAAQRGILL